MRFAGSIGLNVPEIALVPFGRHRPAMLMLRRIEMRAGRSGIWRGAISFFMNMESVLARLQSGDVGDHVDIIAHFHERHRSRDLTARLRFQFAGRVRHILSVRRQRQSAHHPQRND